MDVTQAFLKEIEDADEYTHYYPAKVRKENIAGVSETFRQGLSDNHRLFVSDMDVAGSVVVVIATSEVEDVVWIKLKCGAELPHFSLSTLIFRFDPNRQVLEG